MKLLLFLAGLALGCCFGVILGLEASYSDEGYEGYDDVQFVS